MQGYTGAIRSDDPHFGEKKVTIVKLARRALPPVANRPSWMLHNCVLTTHYPYHEYGDEFGMLQWYSAGPPRGTLRAELLSEEPPRRAGDMLGANVVFEWPDGSMFIAFRITHVGVSHHAGTLCSTTVEGDVLGTVRYGDALARRDAQQRAQRCLPPARKALP